MSRPRIAGEREPRGDSGPGRFSTSKRVDGDVDSPVPARLLAHPAGGAVPVRHFDSSRVPRRASTPRGGATMGFRRPPPRTHPMLCLPLILAALALAPQDSADEPRGSLDAVDALVADAQSMRAAGDASSSVAMLASAIDALVDEENGFSTLDIDARIHDLANLAFSWGDAHSASQAWEWLVDALVANGHPDDSSFLLAARANLVLGWSHVGRFDEARELGELVVRVYDEGDSHDALNAHIARQSLAGVYGGSGDVERAIALMRVALDGYVRLLPQGHMRILEARQGLAAVLVPAGRLAEAQTLLEDALREFEGDASSPDRAFPLGITLATVLKRQGKLASARQTLDRILERSPALGSEHPFVLVARQNRASIRLELGDVEGAREELLEVVPRVERIFGPDHTNTIVGRIEMAGALAGSGRHLEAASALRSLVDFLTPRVPREHPHLIEAWASYCHVAALLGDSRAPRWLEDHVLPFSSPENAWRRRARYATVLLLVGDPRASLTVSNSLLPELTERLPPGHHDLGAARMAKIGALERTGGYEEALALALQVLAETDANPEAGGESPEYVRLQAALLAKRRFDYETARRLEETALANIRDLLHEDQLLLVRVQF